MKSRASRQFLESLELSDDLNIITSVTTECVLRCAYCKSIGKDGKEMAILPDDLLEKIIWDAFRTRRKKICFEWTGGEALLMGSSFYRKVLKCQERYQIKGMSFENILHTSGALYDEKFYNFLVKNNFSISLAIDGPEDLHNRLRPLRCGGPSFTTVMKSLNYIRNIQGNFRTRATITKDSLGREREIIEFFNSIGLKKWYFSHHIHDPNRPKIAAKRAITPEEYHSCLAAQMDACIDADNRGIDTGDIGHFVKALTVINEIVFCRYRGKCLAGLINIDPAGNACICPKFPEYEYHRLGNIRENSISELISQKNPRMIRYIEERLTAIRRCEKEECPYIPICHSGCPYMSLLNSDGTTISGRDILCGAKKKVFEALEIYLPSQGPDADKDPQKISDLGLELELESGRS